MEKLTTKEIIIFNFEINKTLSKNLIFVEKSWSYKK